MGVFTPLDAGIDTHFVYLSRSHATTVNIVVRAQLNRPVEDGVANAALEALTALHPYLVGVVTQLSDTQFALMHSRDRLPTLAIQEASDATLLAIMQRASERKQYLFALERGELAHLQIWRSSNGCVVELSFAHLLGDVTAGLMLFRDLLTFLDQAIAGSVVPPRPRQRLLYNERRLGWNVELRPVVPLSPPPDRPLDYRKWQYRNTAYQRFAMPMGKFAAVRQWLQEHEVVGSVTDVFYYILARLYHPPVLENSKFLAIQSFRHLCSQAVDVENINTSAIFCPLAHGEDLAHKERWIAAVHAARRRAVTEQGVTDVMHFFRCLNRSMQELSVDSMRALISAFVDMDVLAINNYGIVDRFMTGYQHFAVLDVDIQDGAPAQEIRLFSYQGIVHMNPMLDPSGPLAPQELWAGLNYELDHLLGSKRFKGRRA
jgi:hypothetical protein